MANIIDISETLLHGVQTGSQFGWKGIVGGAGLGVGSLSLINHIDQRDKENNGGEASTKGAMMRGFVTGSVASGISTGFDMYAYKHPNSIPSFRSMNAGNDVVGDAKKIEAFMKKDTYKNIYSNYKELSAKQSSLLDKVLSIPQAVINEVGIYEHAPEKVFTHAAKYSMMTGDAPIKDVQPLVDGLSMDLKKMTTAPISHTVQRAKDIYYSAKTYDTGGENKKVDFEHSDKKMNQQMADHVRANPEQYKEMINEYEKTFPNNHIKTTDDLAKFFEGYAPGADAKHYRIEREVYSNPKVSKLTKGITAAAEVMEGSPLWGKVALEQQLHGKAVAKLEKDAEGKMIRTLESSKTAKAIRGLALVGDVAAGGAMMAGLYGVGHAIRHVLKKNPQLDTNTIDSNDAIEPLY